MEITKTNIDEYISELEEPRKSDILLLIDLFKEVSNKEAKLWGSIVGFGNLHYKYKTGREGNMPLIGLANRKVAITLYLSYSISEYPELSRLGKHKVSKSCLYIKKLSDINIDVLKEILIKAVNEVLDYDIITVIE